MATVIKDLGAVTAYGYAKEKGYTGTEDEFAELMASYADVAEQAAESAAQAGASATAAEQAKANAVLSASAAASSASTASTKASEAASSASSASGSAITATTKASEASASATNAASSASAAATSATNAGASATAAAGSASSAETAKTAAETAQGKAETAQGAAETAAQSVSASAAQITQNAEDIGELKSAIESMDTGLSQTEKNLMLTLFRATPFLNDVHEALGSLESIWEGQTPTSFSIIKSLTGCSIDNQTSTVSAGEEFIATITANTGYNLDSITVTMGGTDISASAVSNNVISIPAVSGNVVITAIATKANYTPVEYITQSAGGAYIDTGYYPKLTDVVECEFSLGVSDWSYIFSANDRSTINYSFSTRGDDTAGRTAFTRRPSAWNAKNSADPDFKAQLNTVYKLIETQPGTALLYSGDNTLLATLTDSEVSSVVTETAKLFLFIANASNSAVTSTSKAGEIRLMDFKVKNNLGNIVHHYIPVKDDNDVACMYDTIDKQYLYDGSGNNNFSAGNEVSA